MCDDCSDAWVPPLDYIERVADALLRHVGRYAMYAQTRRTVEVTTRKYRARRKRRR